MPAKTRTVGVCHCANCGIRVFDNGYQAGLAGVIFEAHINGRFGRLCAGCATGNQFITKKTEVVMKKVLQDATGVIANVEVGKAPGKLKPGRPSKYAGVEAVLCDAPIGQWVCVTLVDEKVAKSAYSHLGKKRRRGEFKFEWEMALRLNENCLYVRKNSNGVNGK